MKSIIRGLGLHRKFGLVMFAIIVGAVVGTGTLPVRDALAQTPATVTFQKVIVGPDGMALAGQDLSGFVFTLTPQGGGTPLTFAPTNGAGQTPATPVSQGNYVLGEMPKQGTTFVGQPRFTQGGATITFLAVPGSGAIAVSATNQVAGTGQIVVQKQIVDMNGTPVAGGDVSGFVFAVAGPNGFSAAQTTGTNGTVTFANLGAGTYTVTEGQRAGFTFVASAVDGVPVANGQAFGVGGTFPTTRQVLFQNRVGTATGTVAITKQIVDAQGNIIANANRGGIAFSITCGGQTLNGTTDANGNVTIANVPAGSCQLNETVGTGFTFVNVTPQGGTAVTTNPAAITVTAGQTLNLVVRNQSAGGGTVAITKQIIDAQGNIIANANRGGIVFTITCGTQTFSGTTDANGNITISNVAAGSCQLNETVDSGFTFVNVTPQSGTAVTTNPGAITVTAGQTLNLVVTNRQAPAAVDPVPLVTGCSNQVLTFPAGTSLNVVAAAITPAGALESIFYLDSALGRFRGFSPPPSPAFANDYVTTNNALEAVFICMRQPGTLNRPAR